MIEYLLENLEGDTYPINCETCEPIERESATLADDSFSFDNKVVKRSGEDGDVRLGQTRLTGRELKLTFSRAYQDDADFRLAENDFLAFLRETVYLIDSTNNKKIPVSVNSYKTTHDRGSYQHSANCALALRALNPYWQSLTETTISQTLASGDINDVELDNDSPLPVPTIITLTATSACSNVQIYVSETKQGIEISDTIFGTSGFEEMIINNVEGTLLIGGLDRTQSIVASTGYFKIPVGSSTLKVIPNEDCDIDVTWNVRSYV